MREMTLVLDRKIGVLMAAACMSLAMAYPALAADNMGRFQTGGGAGEMTCPDYVRTRDTASRFAPNTWGYIENLGAFIQFIAGFQTAFNMLKPDTADIFYRLETDQILAWIENYCRAKPLDRFFHGLTSLALENYPSRRRTLP
jgi:hypothetical protein